MNASIFAKVSSSFAVLSIAWSCSFTASSINTRPSIGAWSTRTHFRGRRSPNAAPEPRKRVLISILRSFFVRKRSICPSSRVTSGVAGTISRSAAARVSEDV